MFPPLCLPHLTFYGLEDCRLDRRISLFREPADALIQIVWNIFHLQIGHSPSILRPASKSLYCRSYSQYSNPCPNGYRVSSST